MVQPLAGQVALVAGATRGAGRGIARELAAAGAKVWCTGRSVRGKPATPGRPECIEETVELIERAGGQAVAVQVDHTIESDVSALAAHIANDEGRLDILVNDVWGGDDFINWQQKFWQLEIATVRTLLDRAIVSHLITSRHLVPLMVEANRGLIVEVTDGDLPGYRGQLLYDFVKAGVIRLAYAMAWDLAETKVTALAVTPGFLRSEAMLERFGVTEANWRDAIPRTPHWEFSETPQFVGRAVAALAADPNVGRKAGLALFADDLAEEYGFTDADGTRPNFWKSVEGWLDGQMAAGDLDAHARWMAGARYSLIHMTPAHAPQARRYAEVLGFGALGAGLQPFTAAQDPYS